MKENHKKSCKKKTQLINEAQFMTLYTGLDNKDYIKTPIPGEKELTIVIYKTLLSHDSGYSKYIILNEQSINRNKHRRGKGYLAFIKIQTNQVLNQYRINSCSLKMFILQVKVEENQINVKETIKKKSQIQIAYKINQENKSLNLLKLQTNLKLLNVKDNHAYYKNYQITRQQELNHINNYNIQDFKHQSEQDIGVLTNSTPLIPQNIQNKVFKKIKILKHYQIFYQRQKDKNSLLITVLRKKAAIY
ncbi:hypothetical protein ABPG72_009770 [Tetrahymena utriculariae]